jgi:hypothetical protein
VVDDQPLEKSASADGEVVDDQPLEKSASADGDSAAVSDPEAEEVEEPQT